MAVTNEKEKELLELFIGKEITFYYSDEFKKKWSYPEDYTDVFIGDVVCGDEQGYFLWNSYTRQYVDLEYAIRHQIK